jgi:hypothetical protein
MKKHLFLPLSTVLLFILLLNGCAKKSNPEDNCAQIPKVKITGAKATTYYVGDTIQLGTNMTPLGLYSWVTTNSLNAISNTDGVFIPSCTKYDEGWYYLSVSYPDCASHVDSVYITVTNKVVAAPCNPSNNTISFSGSFPSTSFGSCNLRTDPSTGLKDLSANTSSGYPTFDILFNPYWTNREPEDGAYNISATPTFDQNDLYTVYISSIWSNIYLVAGPGKVYVSHAGGKLQVTFCSIPVSGSLGGPNYTANASGMLTAP